MVASGMNLYPAACAQCGRPEAPPRGRRSCRLSAPLGGGQYFWGPKFLGPKVSTPINPTRLSAPPWWGPENLFAWGPPLVKCHLAVFQHKVFVCDNA